MVKIIMKFKKLIKKPKIIIYSIITYIPLIALLIIKSFFAIRLYNINSIDSDQSYTWLDDSLRFKSESTGIPDFYDFESISKTTVDNDDFLIYILNFYDLLRFDLSVYFYMGNIICTPINSVKYPLIFIFINI